LAWLSGPKTLPSGAGERLPSGKHGSILTYFQAKIKGKVFFGVTERALDKYKFFVLGLTIATTLY
jgi:hypothetical protein